MDFVVLYDIVMGFIDFTKYLFGLITYEFTIGAYSVFGIQLTSGFSFELYQIVLGGATGLFMTILTFRLVKNLVPML